MTTARNRRQPPNNAKRKIDRSSWQSRIDEASEASKESAKCLACHHIRLSFLYDISEARSCLATWHKETAEVKRENASHCLHEIRSGIKHAFQPRMFLPRLEPAIKAIENLAGGTMPNSLFRRARTILKAITTMDELCCKHLARGTGSGAIDPRFVLRMLETQINGLEKELRVFYKEAGLLYDLPALEQAAVKRADALFQ